MVGSGGIVGDNCIFFISSMFLDGVDVLTPIIQERERKKGGENGKENSRIRTVTRSNDGNATNVNPDTISRRHLYLFVDFLLVC